MGRVLQSRPPAGYSLVEALVVVLLVGILSAAAVPLFTGAIGSARTLGSARLVMARCGLARMQAVAQRASIKED